MKICFVGPASSAHIEKWCNWFSNRNHDVHVISFTEGSLGNVELHKIDFGVNVQGSDIHKIRYLFSGKRIKKILDELKPDIVSVHYATSYGMTMALSGYKNYTLSVWGADVYDFPQKSIFHKALIEWSLNKAPILFSTSKAMAREASKYTDKSFFITPFGVDTNLFNPDKRNRDNGDFVVGTVKALDKKYGIEYILQAVAAVKNEFPIKLRIAGKGKDEGEYKALAHDLDIDDITTWLGFISQEDAAREWANMDVAIITSVLESESFGVSAVEAEACSTAVIISDIPGLMEATSPGNSSIVVKRHDVSDIVDALRQLYYSPEQREQMASNGRKFVLENYDIDKCFKRIEEYLVQARGAL